MDIELAWAAGFFDGEGHVGIQSTGYADVHIGQCDPEVLERFQRAVGTGKIHGPYPRKNDNWNPMWEFDACGNDAYEVMTKIYPYLSSIKRKQWDDTYERARIPCRRGFCRKDLHEMTGENRMADQRCKACRQDYYSSRKAGI